MSRPRILIIDDDLSVAQILHDQLVSEGLRVTITNHAEEGFKSAAENPPQLVLLDVNLPGATGFQICDRLRKNPSTQAVPIIMMSGAAKWSNQQQIGKNLGATDYILKPLNPPDVSAKIHSILGTTPQAPEPELEPERMPEARPEPVQASIPVSEPMHQSQPPAPEEVPMVLEDMSTRDHAPLPAATAEGSGEEPISSSIPEPEDSLIREEPLSPIPPSSGRGWGLAWGLFLMHSGLAVTALFAGGAPGGGSDILQEVLQVFGGWTLFLGAFILVTAILKIELSPRSAVGLMGFAAIPIVLRAVLQLVVLYYPSLAALGAATNAARLDLPLASLRPLDLFEMIAAVILGLQIRRQRGASAPKIFVAIFLLIVAWVLTARGYFLPL